MSVEPVDTTRGLLLRLSLLSLAPLLAALVLVYALLGRVGERWALDASRSLAELNLEREGARFRRLFRRAQTQLETLAADPRARGRPEEVAAWLAEVRPGLSGPLEELYHNDLAGNVLSASGVRFNVSDRYYFPASRKGEAVTTHAIVSRDTGRPIVLLLVPVRSEAGQHVASLGATLQLTALFERVRKLRPLGGLAVLWDETGRMVHAYDPPQGASSAETALTPLTRTPSPDRLQLGESTYLVESHELGMAWTLTLLLPEDRALGPLRQLRVRSLLFLACVALLLALATLAIRRLMARPIQRLQFEAERLALEAEVLRTLTEGDLGAALSTLRRVLGAEHCALWGPSGAAKPPLLAQSPAEHSHDHEAGDAFPLSHDQGSLQIVRSRSLEPQERHALETLALTLGLFLERHALAKRLALAERLGGLGRLAGGIAHDLNNMLSVVLASCELARLQDLDPSLGKLIHSIERASERAASLTQQVLTFARSGQVDLEPVDVAGVVRDVCEEQAEWLRDVELVLDLSPDCPPAEAEAGRLHQLVLNLLVNAIDALPREGGRVEIGLRHAKDSVELWVSDNGHGVPSEDLPRLFEPFFTRGKPRGTGLGLSVVHGVVQAFAGTIEVESQPDQGTTFKVLLRASADPLPQQAADSSAAAALGVRVLLVDDEPEVRCLLATLLERGGCDVTALGEPEQALKLLSGNPQTFDLVLSDNSMPGLSGLELATAVGDLRADLPVVLISGLSGELSPDALAAHNVTCLLSKPIDSRELLRAVEAHAAR
ncbi:MAG TPA: hypothetical protein DEA08_22905 [Planctomycetes bacterium]|nr:hypothetical protein [Planctomycetota bacterium]